MVDAVDRDVSSEALAGSVDAGKVEMRQEVVDPFVVGICRKSSDINVIVPNLFILHRKDKITLLMSDEYS